MIHCPLCRKILSKRDDDNLNIINKRFKIFKLYTQPTIKRISLEHRVIEMDNQKKIKDILFALKRKHVK